MEDDQKLSKRERKKLNREKKQQETKVKESQSSLTRKLLFIALAIGGALLFWQFLTADSGISTDTPIGSVELREGDNTKGATEPKVTIVEYSDFQCPACLAYQPIVSKILEEYPNDVMLVYRHFPLRTIHKNAQLAAQASEAAAKQGKFWEMHDKLFETQNVWSDLRSPQNDFLGYAEDLGLDRAQFEADLYSDEVETRVNADFNDALALGINSTPSFFVNGEKISNPQGYEAFKQLIDTIIAQMPEQNVSTESAEIVETE